MPLNVLLTFIIGAALGWLLVKLMRVPHHLQGLVLGCCAAGRKIHLHFLISLLTRLIIIYNFFNNLKHCKLSYKNIKKFLMLKMNLI